MKRYIILIVVIAALCSCDEDIYDNIKEMVDSETVYPAGYRQAIPRSGKERVEIDLYPSRLPSSEMEKKLPRAKKTVVEYGAERLVIDSVCSWVNITGLTIPMTYQFKIYTENEWGDQSTPITTQAKPFTPADRDALVFSATATASPTAGVVRVASSLEAYTINQILYSYIDKDGVTHSEQAVTNTFIVNNLKVGAINTVHVSLNILPRAAIDTAWISGNVLVNTLSQEVYDNYLSETWPFPLGATHTLSAGAPLYLPSFDFDFGGRGKAWETNQSRAFSSDYRSRNGDPNCLVEVDGIPGSTPSAIVWVANTNSWYTYIVEVVDPGEYLIEVDYAPQLPESPNPQALITVDFLDYYGIVPLPVDAGSGWSVHQSGYGKPVYFGAGKHKVKFQILGSPIQYYGLRFTKVD